MPLPSAPIRKPQSAIRNDVTIRVLSAAVTARIAAGEVVERPASVVKELAENALDAGAKRIHVEIAGGGRELVRVSDDGRGMSPADLGLCLLSHATSKLQSADELVSLSTLGFRGEALPSIGAVSKLQIVSCARAQSGPPEAWRIETHGGEPEQPEAQPAAGPPGTTVEMRELFFNLPARLKFLRGAAAEAAACTDTLLRLALSRPDVGFTLKQDRHEIFSVAPVSSAPAVSGPAASCAAPTLPLAAYAQRAREILGRANSQGLLEVAFAGPAAPENERTVDSDNPEAPRLPAGYRLFGLLSPPAVTRPNRGAIYLMINGRPVKDRTLTSALLEAYRHLLPPRRFPIAVLWLELPGSDVDINVHPQKSEVRFRLPGLVYALLHNAVRSSCGVPAAPGAPPVTLPAAPHVPLGAPQTSHGQRAFDLWPRVEAIIARRELPLNSTGGRGDGESGGVASATVTPYPPVPPSPRLPIEFSSIAAEAPAPFAVTAPAPQAAPAPSAPFRVLGQAGGSYIVLEDDSGVKLIDQHALHERVLFEILLERAQGHARGDAQGLLLPESIELSPVQAAVFAQDSNAFELLQNLGFEAESFGPRTIVVRAVPAILKSSHSANAAKLVVDVLDAIADATESGKPGKAASRTHWREKAVYVLCCKGAIKAGERLTTEQMTTLVAEYRRRVGSHGFTCPHGRPVALEISWAELERAVGR